MGSTKPVVGAIYLYLMEGKPQRGKKAKRDSVTDTTPIKRAKTQDSDNMAFHSSQIQTILSIQELDLLEQFDGVPERQDSVIELVEDAFENSIRTIFMIEEMADSLLNSAFTTFSSVDPLIEFVEESQIIEDLLNEVKERSEKQEEQETSSKTPSTKYTYDWSTNKMTPTNQQ